MKRKPLLEKLEVRLTPSFSQLTFSSEGVLYVQTGEAQKTYTRFQQPNPVVSNILVEEVNPNAPFNVLKSYSFQNVNYIHYEGGAGDDTVENSSSKPMWALGKAGNDNLYGSRAAKDYLFGGLGNDLIKGLGGKDWLSGGWGEDTIDLSLPDSDTVQADYEIRIDGNMTFFPVSIQGGNRESTLDAMVSNATGYFGKVLLNPFPGFHGEFYTSAGDLNGDGIEDLVCGSGQGSANGHVVVFDGARVLETFSREFTRAGNGPFNYEALKISLHQAYNQGGSVRASLYAFVKYSSGVAVRLADVNDDGYDDFVLAPGSGAGRGTPAHMRVWDGLVSMQDFSAGKPIPYDYRWELASFYAFGDDFQPAGGMQISTLRQQGPDLVVASLLFSQGARVFRFDGHKSMPVETEIKLASWGNAFRDPSMGVTIAAFGGNTEKEFGGQIVPRMYALLPRYGDFGRGIHIVGENQFYHFIFATIPGVQGGLRLVKGPEKGGMEDLMVLNESNLAVGSYKIDPQEYKILGDFYFEDVQGVGAWG